jgi:hypothetical protein
MSKKTLDNSSGLSEEFNNTIQDSKTTVNNIVSIPYAINLFPRYEKN